MSTTIDNAQKWRDIENMKWTSEDHKGWSKWGRKPYWTQDVHHLNGIVKKCNGDGTYEVEFYCPLDPYGETRSATMTIEYKDIFSSYERCKERINNFAKRLEIGNKVKINVYSNLFYIYLWEKKFRYGEFKYEFVCGKPYSSYKKKYCIDVRGGIKNGFDG